MIFFKTVLNSDNDSISTIFYIVENAQRLKIPNVRKLKDIDFCTTLHENDLDESLDKNVSYCLSTTCSNGSTNRLSKMRI